MAKSRKRKNVGRPEQRAVIGYFEVVHDCLPHGILLLPNSVKNHSKVPKIDKKLMAEIEANPYETRSDSFYFVDGQLVMHHRADYSYKQ